MRRTHADAIRGTLRSSQRMISRRLQGLHRAPEDGIALVLSVIVMSVLTISTAATITAVTSNEHAFGRDRQVNRALNIAEAGMNAGVAAVKALPATATSMSPASGTTDGGSWSYTATRAQDSTNPDLYYWTVTSTGVSPYSNVTRIVSTKVAETVTHHSTTVTTTTPASDAYRYGFFLGDPSSDCTTTGSGNNFGGNLDIRVSVMARGSLCLSGNEMVQEPVGSSGTVDLYVGRKLQLSGNNAAVGASSAKIRKATVVAGCIRSVAVTCSSSSSSHVYANTYSSTQSDIPPPTINTAWYTNSKPGPVTGCNDSPTDPAQTSTYPSGYTAATFKNALFDGNSTMDRSLGTFDPLTKFGTSSFDCRYYNSDGTLAGRLAWNYGNPGTLTILGTIWMDGNLAFTGSYAIVHGRGTLYVSGTVAFSGQAKLCEQPSSGSNCQGVYDPASNLLELVAYNNNSHTTTGFSLSGNSSVVFEGIAFTYGTLSETGQANLNGQVLADTASMAGNGKTLNGTDPPPGAPGAQETTTTTTGGPDTAVFAGVPGSWQQLLQ
jgi:Tfp pilus assembly protein PilX